MNFLLRCEACNTFHVTKSNENLEENYFFCVPRDSFDQLVLYFELHCPGGIICAGGCSLKKISSAAVVYY